MGVPQVQQPVDSGKSAYGHPGVATAADQVPDTLGCVVTLVPLSQVSVTLALQLADVVVGCTCMTIEATVSTDGSDVVGSGLGAGLEDGAGLGD